MEDFESLRERFIFEGEKSNAEGCRLCMGVRGDEGILTDIRVYSSSLSIAREKFRDSRIVAVYSVLSILMDMSMR